MLLMGKLTISMVIFNSKLLVHQRVTSSNQLYLIFSCPPSPKNAERPIWFPDSCEIAASEWSAKDEKSRFDNLEIIRSYMVILGPSQKIRWKIPGEFWK